MDKRVKAFAATIENLNEELLKKDFEYLKENNKNLDRIIPYIDRQISKNDSMWLVLEVMGINAPNKQEMLHFLVLYFKAKEKFKKITGTEYEGDGKELPRLLLMEYNSLNDLIIKFESVSEGFESAVKKYSHYEKEFSFNEKTYYAIIPKTQKELIIEGYRMHNCLVMRGPDVAEGRMKVVFLREEKTKSYIDIIMNEHNNIIWAITDHHENTKGENLNAVYEWYRSTIKNVPLEKMWV